MSHNKNHDSQQLPVGRLGIISPYSCAELGTKVDNYLVSWRKKRHNEGVLYEGYDRDTYLIGSDLPRFGSGEAKGILKESVRGDDIYILVDVCNYSLTYSLAGQTNHMSPDDHYQNLKRIIAAIAGKARRINVIMPFLYESRQHRRTGRESLDYVLRVGAGALEQLDQRLGGGLRGVHQDRHSGLGILAADQIADDLDLAGRDADVSQICFRFHITLHPPF